MSYDVAVAAVLAHARGVIAEGFGVGISTADAILNDVARDRGRDVTELATEVVASSTAYATPLPQRIYAVDDWEGTA